MSLWPGEIVAGKYRVERVLGKGGFGEVVAATHVHLGQRVALKILLDDIAAQPALVERFMREARATVKLRSQHVARVLDIAALPSGLPYIVMEYLDGEDLARALARNGPMPVHMAATCVLDACEAIAEAHALGIVHRDLKPANLFLARGAGGAPIVKVLDFGISKIAPSLEEQRLTRTHVVLGSPLYASPEQLRSTKHVDLRTDIWALGVTLYELVAGVVPFAGTSLAELSIRVTVDPAPPLPPEARAPAAFEALIHRCLEKDPVARFANVGELAQALAPFAGAQGKQRADQVQRALGRPTRSPVRRKRRRFLVAAAIALVAIGLALLISRLA